MNAKIKISILFAMLMVLFTGPISFAGQSTCEYGSSTCSKGDKCELEQKFFYKYRFINHNAEALSLSEGQQERMAQLMFEVKKDLILADAESDVAKLSIMSEIKKDQPNQTAIDLGIKDLVSAKQKRLKALANGILTLKKELSAEQRAQMKEFKK